MKLAVVGTGNIVKKFLYGVSKSDGWKWAGVCSRKEETGRRFVEECKELRQEEVRVYTDYGAMLADAGLDLIYVALPNSLHFEYAKEALEAGKHVICEKPFTMTLEETDQLIGLAKEKGLFLFEAITTRNLPNYQIVREKLPMLGRIRMVQCNFSQYSSRYGEYLEGRTPNVFSPGFGGGCLNDLNVYNLHFVIGLFGHPLGGSYFANQGREGIDLSGVGVLHYDGFQAVCVAAKDSDSPNFALIQGERGYLKVEGQTSRCPRIVACTEGRTESIGVQDEENVLVYEVLAFERTMNEGDLAACQQKLNESREVMEVLVALRDGATFA